MEGFDRVRGLFWRHGVGQVHAHECHVNIFQSPHFRHAFRIAGEVKAFSAVGKYVAVAAALIVIKLARRGAARDVIGGLAVNISCVPFLLSPLAIGLALVTVATTAGGAMISVPALLISAIEAGSM